MAFGKKKAASVSAGFVYKPRDRSTYEKRATAGSSREGFLAEGVNMFSPKVGAHSVRILPPTWKNPDHYGFDAYAHYDIGPDGGSYLCLDRMKGETCPICEERQRAVAAGEEELVETLKWRRRVLCWVIDRDNEKEGPLLWSMPQSLDKEISSVCQDKKTGEVYSPDDPSANGYDVSFEREGERLKTKYVGVVIDRRPSPLSDDEEQAKEWLEFVSENPIPDQLVYQDADYIAGLVEGGLTSGRGARDKAKEDEDDKKKPARKAKPAAKEEEPEEPAEELTWEDVHALDEGELTALAEEHDIDISDCDDEEDAANTICKALDIEAPEEEKEEEEPPAKKKLVPLKKRTADKEEAKPSRLEQLRKKRKG